jgi:DNA mismatch endonuclease (patch repair protein)
MDRLAPEYRSENMRRIRSKGMKPEMLVRSLVHGLGYRYRLHRSDIPGKPDLVFGSRRKVIFVHGCFWHGHTDPNCVDGRRKPKSNLDYWLPKLERNQERDITNEAELMRLGWSIMVVWECETRDTVRLADRLRLFLISV